MKWFCLYAALLAPVVSAQEAPSTDHPVHLDRTGIEWETKLPATDVRGK